MSTQRPDFASESLESRLLLSTSLNSRGVLYVLGTSKADALSAYLAANDPTKIEVRDRGVISQFQRSAVTQVIFQGFSGADTIVISNVNGRFSTPTKVYGEAGNDTIQGGGTRDRVYGGTGNDSILGGGGHDILYGEAGNDTLVGERGNDYLVGGAGTDMLEGNRGLDRFIVEPGIDHVNFGTEDEVTDAVA